MFSKLIQLENFLVICTTQRLKDTTRVYEVLEEKEFSPTEQSWEKNIKRLEK